MKIDKINYDYLIRLTEQRDMLTRELNVRVRAGQEAVEIDTLKTIFDLWDDVPAIEKKGPVLTGNAEAPCISAAETAKKPVELALPSSECSTERTIP